MAKDEREPRRAPRFGYAGTASGQKYDFWREEFCRRVMAVDLTPMSTGQVACDVTPLLLPQVRISGSIGTPMRFTSLGMSDELVLLLAPNSPLHVVMGDRETHIDTGSLSLGDAEVKGAFVTQLEEGEFKTVLINRKKLTDLCANAEDQVGRVVAPDPGLLALIYKYYEVVVSHAPNLDALAQNAVAQHLADLAALALGARPDAAEQARGRGLAAARLEAIKIDILSHLDESDLTVSAVARRHGATPRYVQMLFERTGVTFSEFVLEQRLLRATRLLCDPMHRARKISDIVHLAGFNDVSYFNRSFRRRFGMTPSDARKIAMESE